MEGIHRKQSAVDQQREVRGVDVDLKDLDVAVHVVVVHVVVVHVVIVQVRVVEEVAHAAVHDAVARALPVVAVVVASNSDFGVPTIPFAPA